MAARRVYDTPELRCSILELLDRTALAGMLRLEKAVTASVAGVLYREVPRYLVRKMSRATPRRATYCDAVRILDWSNFTSSQRFSAFRGINDAPIRFDPETFLNRIRTWKKKYPQLQKVRFQYPDHGLDDAYVVHMLEDKYLVELESRIELRLHKRPVSLPGPQTFPKPPVHKSIEYRQTFIPTFVTLRGDHAGASGDRELRIQQWSRWMYDNPDADRRITGVDRRGPESSITIELSFDETMSYLALRKANDCLPLTQFHIDTPTTPSQLRELATGLGPHLRTLSFTRSDLSTFGELQLAIDIFTSAFPLLQSLRIDFYGLGEYDFDSSSPLSGLPSLRQFVFTSPRKVPFSKCARYIAGLGAKECVYIRSGSTSSGMASIHRVVRDARTKLLSATPAVEREQA